MVLLSAQSMSVVKIAEVTFSSANRVRDVIHNFNTDGFDSLCPKRRGGRPRTFGLPERRDIKKIAKSKSAEQGLPFSTWSLTKPTDFLVAAGMAEVIFCTDEFGPLNLMPHPGRQWAEHGGRHKTPTANRDPSDG